MTEPDVDVLIVGAGPTGLMLAGWLARLGVSFRLIDKKDALTRESRALAVQARSLEAYDQLGIGAQALAQGLPVRAVNIWANRRHAGRAPYGAIGRGISPHPYVFILGQDRNEALLLAHLQAHGGEVRWECALAGLSQDESGVSAELSYADGRRETIRARYVCGCDGAGSMVRHALSIGFPGGTYEQRFFVADIAAEGTLREGELNLCFESRRFLAFFPMPGEGRFRIVGIVPPERIEAADAHTLTLADLQPDIEARFEVSIRDCSWFSTYRVHHRVAETFQRGRGFLLGDAGHVHSPAGGQGMNTGLMDAVNLAWKLAWVLQGRCDERLLASYDLERRPFAQALVATTDRAFGLATSSARSATWLRTGLIPAFFAIGSRLQPMRRQLYRLLSQTRVQYRKSPLSQGRAGAVKAGDRLPWVPDAFGRGDGSDNFAALQDLGVSLQVYGPVSPALEAYAARHPELPLRRYPHGPEAAAAGLAAGAVYLVRPDGYVAYAADSFNAADFALYLRRAWGWQAAADEVGVLAAG